MTQSPIPQLGVRRLAAYTIRLCSVGKITPGIGTDIMTAIQQRQPYPSSSVNSVQGKTFKLDSARRLMRSSQEKLILMSTILQNANISTVSSRKLCDFTRRFPLALCVKHPAKALLSPMEHTFLERSSYRYQPTPFNGTHATGRGLLTLCPNAGFLKTPPPLWTSARFSPSTPDHTAA